MHWNRQLGIATGGRIALLGKSLKRMVLSKPGEGWRVRMRWLHISFRECLGKCSWATGNSEPSDSTDLGAEKSGSTRYPGIYHLPMTLETRIPA